MKLRLWEQLNDLNKKELIDLICAYDNYIVNNYDEMQGSNWIPVCLSEFYDNEYQEEEEE